MTLHSREREREWGREGSKLTLRLSLLGCTSVQPYCTCLITAFKWASSPFYVKSDHLQPLQYVWTDASYPKTITYLLSGVCDVLLMLRHTTEQEKKRSRVERAWSWRSPSTKRRGNMCSSVLWCNIKNIRSVSQLLFARTATFFFHEMYHCVPSCCVNQAVLHHLSLYLFEPAVSLSLTWSWGDLSLPQFLCVSLITFLFIYSAHAYSTTPYLKVTHKRIMRSLRNAFMKWIISDWLGFLKLLTHQIFHLKTQKTQTDASHVAICVHYKQHYLRLVHYLFGQQQWQTCCRYWWLEKERLNQSCCCERRLHCWGRGSVYLSFLAENRPFGFNTWSGGKLMVMSIKAIIIKALGQCRGSFRCSVVMLGPAFSLLAPLGWSFKFAGTSRMIDSCLECFALINNLIVELWIVWKCLYKPFQVDVLHHFPSWH